MQQRRFANQIIQLYLQGKDPKSPEVSPFWRNDLFELPPTDIILGKYDRLRGEIENFAKKLKKNGVETHEFLIKGNHGAFWRNKHTAIIIGSRLNILFNSKLIKFSLTKELFQNYQKILLETPIESQITI